MERTAISLFALSAPSAGARAAGKPAAPELAGQVGITTSSLSYQVADDPKAGQFTLFDMPKFLRDELGMRVIDLNTSTLGSADPDRLDRLRNAAEKAGCVITNLKMNQSRLDMAHPDPNVRGKALAEYQGSIEAASRLGARWARPLPGKTIPDMPRYVDAYRQLADFAADRSVQMLVENYGWMADDPQSVPNLIAAIGRNVRACPDTGSWANNEVRFLGLARAFPLAVTCDFKAREIDASGRHGAYDLERCFRIGWESGFRGPWCLEHAHRDTPTLVRDLVLLRDQILGWIRTASEGKGK